MAAKKFQDLNLSNAFLFAVTLEDPENCGLVLEMLLERNMGNVVVQTERSLLFDTEARYVRLDVYASDEAGISYNVEMQNENEGNLPKRVRYHQAELYRYTFEHRCLEREMPLGDETGIIFFNIKGKNDTEVPSQLVHFLKYLENTTDAYVGTVQDTKVERLHTKVKAIKQSRMLEERYMQFEEMLNKRETRGREEGEKLKVIAQITKKTAKGLPPEVIADHLEEDVSFVQKICETLLEHPEATPEEILTILS